jgi:hypothetical protein
MRSRIAASDGPRSGSTIWNELRRRVAAHDRGAITRQEHRDLGVGRGRVKYDVRVPSIERDRRVSC